jgi:hypothetical protein
MTEDIVLESVLDQLRGVIGRYPEPGQRFIFEFETVEKRLVHMVGVSRPLLVEFVVCGRLQESVVLPPWLGVASQRCDKVIERRPPRLDR